MKNLFLIVCLFCLSVVSSYCNFEKGTVIRDAEIEEILKSYIDPLFEKANLDKKDLNLVIIIDPEVNAAATINTTLIINSGFLLKTTRLEEVLGVLAHEVGHLEGRHIIRMIEAIDQAKKASILSVAAGLALGVLSQRPDLGAALATGGSISSVYSFLSYNRGEEASADQAALKYLNALGWPSEGLASFFEKLLNQELLSSSLQDPYARSHPLTKDRLESVKSQLKKLSTPPLPKKMVEGYETLKAKLEAFLMSPDMVLHHYKGTSSLQKYAQAIAYYRQGKTDASLKLLQALVKEFPTHPYYVELQGQIHYEAGQLNLAINNYRRALSLKPKEPLFQLGLAQALIALNKNQELVEAQNLLEQVQQEEPRNVTVWHFLSIVYGRLNKMGAMALSLAEKAVLLEKWDEADEQVKRALHYLDKKDPLYVHAQDLQLQAKREKNKNTQTSRL